MEKHIMIKKGGVFDDSAPPKLSENSKNRPSDTRYIGNFTKKESDNAICVLPIEFSDSLPPI
ncbi:hypothetical protein AGMMS49944_25800 [Spirochaetia bacterium]|nr:hypothetical protein AGMMS49944_25800 [Spirochaetia bacterium]